MKQTKSLCIFKVILISFIGFLEPANSVIGTLANWWLVPQNIGDSILLHKKAIITPSLMPAALAPLMTERNMYGKLQMKSEPLIVRSICPDKYQISPLTKRSCFDIQLSGHFRLDNIAILRYQGRIVEGHFNQ